MLNIKTKKNNYKLWWEYSSDYKTSSSFEKDTRIITTTEIWRNTILHLDINDNVYVSVKASCSPDDKFEKAIGRVLSLKKLISTGILETREALEILATFENTIKNSKLELLYNKQILTKDGFIQLSENK